MDQLYRKPLKPEVDSLQRLTKNKSEKSKLLGIEEGHHYRF